jgi:hypothetical protein
MTTSQMAAPMAKVSGVVLANDHGSTVKMPKPEPADGQCDRHKHVDPSLKMVLQNAIVEAKLVEQLALVTPLPTHHPPVRRRRSSVDGITVRRPLSTLYRQHRPKGHSPSA